MWNCNLRFSCRYRPYLLFKIKLWPTRMASLTRSYSRQAHEQKQRGAYFYRFANTVLYKLWYHPPWHSRTFLYTHSSTGLLREEVFNSIHWITCSQPLSTAPFHHLMYALFIPRSCLCFIQYLRWNLHINPIGFAAWRFIVVIFIDVDH